VTPFRIGLCQARTYGVEEPEANLQELLELLDDAGQAGCQLVATPECSYPAYYLRDPKPYARDGVRSYEEVCAVFAHYARKYGYWLAAGIARPAKKGLANSAVIFDPEGEVRGHYDKSFLWHFDGNWFQPGREFPVWDAGFCKFGALICADGRQPEIARSLAVNGAELILDLTAWVSWGRDPALLNNPQCEYFMPARAFENGVWVAAADKWGPEAGTIVYAGRSTVIAPTGETLVCAPSEGSTVVVYDIDPVTVETVPRRPSLYAGLIAPTKTLPVTKVLQEPLIPAEESHRVAVVPSNGAFDAARTGSLYRECRAQGADLVVFGGDDGPEGWQVALPALEALVRDVGGALALGVTTTGCSIHQSAALITPEGTTEHAATHGRGIQLGEALCPVIPTPAGNVALLCGDEGLVPEVSRDLMLRGAEILAWTLFADTPMTERLARTRADENRVYAAAAWPGGALVAGPAGGLLTAAPEGSGLAMAAQVNRALSRWKDMAPGTNVVRHRIPDAYRALVQ